MQTGFGSEGYKETRIACNISKEEDENETDFRGCNRSKGL